MEDAPELLSVHLCSLLTPVSLFLFHLLAPGGFLGSPLLVLCLLSLATTLAALLAPFLFLCPVELHFSPVKPFSHYVRFQLPQRQRQRQQQQTRNTAKRHRSPDVVLKGSSFVQVLLASTSLYVIVGTLLGADPIRKLQETVVWALLMTSLTSVPVAVLLDLDPKTWKRVLLDRLFVTAAERGLYVMVMATLLGAWLGAVPIPLDWNTPWQVWPIPCGCGAMLGSVLGSGCSLLARQLSLYPPQLGLQSRWLTRYHHKRPNT